MQISSTKYSYVLTVMQWLNCAFSYFITTQYTWDLKTFPKQQLSTSTDL